MTLTWLASSRDYVYAKVSPPPGVVLGAQPVKMAVVPVNQFVVDGDFKVAEWAPDVPDAVRLLVGRGTTNPLVTGQYDVIVRITDGLAEPDLRAGMLRVVAD